MCKPKDDAKKAVIIQEAVVYGDELHIDLFYPGGHEPGCGEPKSVVLGLCDVRAADDIRLSYDFERDGWKIEQASCFVWGEDDETNCDPDWQEVAFVQAWARDKRNEEDIL